MSLRVDQDHARFKHIIRGRIRQNLRRYISQGELMGKQGKDVVSIPIPQIDIPKFRFSDKQGGGNGSWNSTHPSRGCSQPNLVATGGAGLIYCFAIN